MGILFSKNYFIFHVTGFEKVLRMLCIVTSSSPDNDSESLSRRAFCFDVIYFIPSRYPSAIFMRLPHLERWLWGKNKRVSIYLSALYSLTLQTPCTMHQELYVFDPKDTLKQVVCVRLYISCSYLLPSLMAVFYQSNCPPNEQFKNFFHSFLLWALYLRHFVSKSDKEVNELTRIDIFRKQKRTHQAAGYAAR